MEKQFEKITVETTVNVPAAKTWQLWTGEEHITKWNSASPDWHSPSAKNDVRTGGSFSVRMEAKDGSFGFDFGGVYDNVIPNKLIEYTMGDGRKVVVKFTEHDGHTHIEEIFDAEKENSLYMQKSGWQSIMDNFKKYAENN